MRVRFLETQPKKRILCLNTRLTLISRIFSGLLWLLRTAVWAEENTKTKTKQALAETQLAWNIGPNTENNDAYKILSCDHLNACTW